jgi:hypothetical protein
MRDIFPAHFLLFNISFGRGGSKRANPSKYQDLYFDDQNMFLYAFYITESEKL